MLIPSCRTRRIHPLKTPHPNSQRRRHPATHQKSNIKQQVPRIRQISLLPPKNMPSMSQFRRLPFALPQRTRQSQLPVHSASATLLERHPQMRPCSVRTLTELRGRFTIKMHRLVGLRLVTAVVTETVEAVTVDQALVARLANELWMEVTDGCYLSSAYAKKSPFTKCQSRTRPQS